MNCQSHLHRGQDPREVSRRWFLQDCGVGLGAMAMGALAGSPAQAARAAADDMPNPLSVRQPHFPAKAKNVIFLFMAGAPSHLEMFDNKPQLAKFDGTLPPKELIEGYRAAFINPSSNSPNMGSVGPSFPSCCRAWPRWSTTSRSSSRWPPTPSTMPRPKS